MSSLFVRKRGEDGATLIFVIGFMVLVGLITAGLATQLESSSHTRVALDNQRDREYAADAAITSDIAQVRTNMTRTPPDPAVNALAPCPSTTWTQTLNDVDIRVDCSFSLLSFSGAVLRNATFTASCAPQSHGATCPTGVVIMKAQVHYSTPDPQPALNATSINVNKSYVATWSVTT